MGIRIALSLWIQATYSEVEAKRKKKTKLN